MGENYPKKVKYINNYLANTYEKIAKQGRDIFYKGEIAKTIGKFIKEQGGFSVKDLLLQIRMGGTGFYKLQRL